VLGLSVIDVGDHRIHVDGRSLWARCAFDALFLPELLGERARVTSRCPTRRWRDLPRGHARRGRRPRPARDGGLLTPEERFASDVVQSFCDVVYFFASAKATTAWTRRHPGTFALSVADAYRLGQLANHASLGAGLDAPRA
jgi:alkylmercury lyase